MSDPSKFDVDFNVTNTEDELIPINYGRGLSAISAAQSVVMILTMWDDEDRWYSPLSIEVRKSQ